MSALATPAEISWLAKRYSREVPTTRARDVDALYRRGLVSLVWRPRGYREGESVPRHMTLCTFCTPLGRRVVDDYKRARRAPGGTDLVAPPSPALVGGAHV